MKLIMQKHLCSKYKKKSKINKKYTHFLFALLTVNLSRCLQMIIRTISFIVVAVIKKKNNILCLYISTYLLSDFAKYTWGKNRMKKKK